MTPTASVILLAVLSVAQIPAGEPTESELRKQIRELADKINTQDPKTLAKHLEFEEAFLQDLEKRLADAQATVKKLQDQQASDTAINNAKYKREVLAVGCDRMKQTAEQTKKDLEKLKALQAKLAMRVAERARDEFWRQLLGLPNK